MRDEPNYLFWCNSYKTCKNTMLKSLWKTVRVYHFEKTFTSVLLCLKKQNREACDLEYDMIQVFSNTCLLNVVELLLFLEDAEKGLDLGGS